MDQISLTDIRMRFFGPTLDESVLYGIDCLMDIFEATHNRSTADEEFKLAAAERNGTKKALSDLHLYKSCHDVTADRRNTSTSQKSEARSESSPQPDENMNQLGKAGSSSVSFETDVTGEKKETRKTSFASSQNEAKESVREDDAESRRTSIDSPDCKCSDQMIKVLSDSRRSSELSNTAGKYSRKLSDLILPKRSSKEEAVSSKKRITSTPLKKEPIKSSRTSRSSSSDRSSKPKAFSNSQIIDKLKKDLANNNLIAIKSNRSTPNSSREDRISPRKRSSSTNSRHPSNIVPKLLSSHPKQVLTRWAVARVFEYDDGAKTYEMFPYRQQNPFGLAKLSDVPPDVSPEVVFANLPDGFACSYRFDRVKDKQI